jgi:myosin heavy subunit
MSDARKPKPKGKRGQLLHELEELKAAYNDQENKNSSLQQELVSSQEQVKTLQARVAELLAELEHAKEIEAEVLALKKQLQLLSESSAKQIEQGKRELRELERKHQRLEQENRELRKQLEAVTKSDADVVLETSELETDEIDASQPAFGEAPSTSPSIIEVMDNDISPELMVGSSVEESPAFEETDADEKMQMRKTDGQASKIPAFRTLEEISIRQSNQQTRPGQPLKSSLPFTVVTKMKLPAMPTSSKLSDELVDFAVRVAIHDNVAAEPAESGSAMGEIIDGQRDYEMSIPMPSLEPGQYSLRVSALVPYMRIGEQQDVEIQVAD